MKELSLWKRLKRLELFHKTLSCEQYPDDIDNFIEALIGERKEQYKKGNGYDTIAALNSTAFEDWNDYE